MSLVQVIDPSECVGNSLSKINNNFKSLQTAVLNGNGTTSVIATGSTTSRTLQDRFADVVNVKDFGAKGDGVTDDSAAIQAALNNGSYAVFLPPARYRCASGITIPPNVELFSKGGLGGNNGYSNSVGNTALIFDNSVLTCITMSGGSNPNYNNSCVIDGFTIMRPNVGIIPANSIGVLNNLTQGSKIRNINILSQAIGLYFKSDGIYSGIYSNITDINTGAITDSHVVIDTMPEVRFNQCRFGTNGGIDKACNSFVRIQGGSTFNSASGPNTVYFINCHFNQGGGVIAGKWVSWENKLAGSIADASLFVFDSCYIETVGCGLNSDNTWDYIRRLQMSNCTYNMPYTNGFMNLNVATSIDKWFLSNNFIGGTFNLAPTNTIYNLNISNCEFEGRVNITGPNNTSNINISDCIYGGGLELQGTFDQACIKGGSIKDGNDLVNTSTGITNIDVYPYNAFINSWNPQLAFGGSTTGIVQSFTYGHYSLINRLVTVYFTITVSNIGSATGNAQILNLPYIINNPTCGNITTLNNVTGISNAPYLNVGTGTYIQIMQFSSTGSVALTNSNFTNTSIIAGSVSYYINN